MSQDSGTHHFIVENCKTSQYAWNSTPIDNTDIFRSMAAVGCHFKYPMDVSLNEDPSMKFKDHSVVHLYGISRFCFNLAASIRCSIIPIPLHFELLHSFELSLFIGLVGLGFILTKFVVDYILLLYKPNL